MKIISETRRQFLAGLGAAALAGRAAAAPGKTMRGVFIIMATPYTAGGEVDYEDLAREVDYLDRCGAHGMVWPQLASEYSKLTRDERMRGMETIAKAAKGRKPALVLGVQAGNTEAALEFARRAEALEPDALISMPPSEAKSADEFRPYFTALAGATKRPVFIQTTGGPKNLAPSVELLAALAREFPNLGYIKEEEKPAIERMQALARHRPAVKAIFSGAGGRSMLYEARLGFDGTMPGAAYSDIHAQVWDLYQAGRRDEARDLFGRLLLMQELENHIPGTRQYIMRKRGVFKTMVSRQRKGEIGPEAAREIDFNFEALRPYLRAK